MVENSRKDGVRSVSKMKKTEIGVIPEDWEVKKVSEISRITTGNKNTQDRIENGIYPFFVRSQTIERINSFSFEGEAVLTAGDGVGVGKVFHYINGKFDYHQRVYAISHFDTNVYGFYFFKYFQNNFYNRIMQMTAKSSVDSVRMETIADMLIPLPPLAEQEAIATALSDADVWIEHLEQLIAKKRLIKQGAMQELLTPPSEELVLSGAEAWEVKKLGEVAEIITGNTPSTRDESNYGDEYLFISPADLGNNKYIVHSEKKLSKKGFALTRKLNKNAILVTCIGSTIGKIGIAKFECCTNQQINSLITNSENNYNYVYYLLALNAELIKQNASQQAVPLLNKTDFSELEFSFPSLSEQERIATILSDMDAELEALEQQLGKAQQIKQGMMQELLTGKTRLIDN